MKVTELRIGNFINTPNPHMNPFEVECVERDKVGGNNSLNQFVYWGEQNISPIPLTEDWLVRVGFEKQNGIIDVGPELLASYLERNEWFHLVSDHDGFYLPEDDYDGVKHKQFEKPIKYVHQLQNLYFALTGQELTIKKEGL